MALKDITTQNPEHAPKILNLWRKGLFKSNIQEFDNFIKENQNKPKEFNIGSNKVAFEMNEDTTNYEVSRA